jgi:hypothetical protein
VGCDVCERDLCRLQVQVSVFFYHSSCKVPGIVGIAKVGGTVSHIARMCVVHAGSTLRLYKFCMVSKQ